MARPSWAGAPSSSDSATAPWGRAEDRLPHHDECGLIAIGAPTATTVGTIRGDSTRRLQPPAMARVTVPRRARQGKWSVQFVRSTLPSEKASGPQQHYEPQPAGPSYAVASARFAAPAILTDEAHAKQDLLTPFVPQDLSPMPRVLLDPTWPGFRVSALCLGTFDDRGFGAFAVERDTQIQHGLLDFAITLAILERDAASPGRKGRVGISGYAFDAFPGIKLSFRESTRFCLGLPISVGPFLNPS